MDQNDTDNVIDQNDDLKEDLTEDVAETEEQKEDETVEDENVEVEESKEEPIKKSIDDFQDEASVIMINPDEDKDAKWYVVHTYSGHEKKVASQVKDRVDARGFKDKFFKVLIPQQQKIVVSEGKKRKVDERLFPGYILVQMILNDDTWYLVRSTRGVTGFVGTGTNPTPLPEKEVQTLVKFMRTEEPKFEAKFSIGDAVKITDGPFAEFLGKVDEVNDEQGKLKVLVSVFGRETPVELDFMQVKSI